MKDISPNITKEQTQFNIKSTKEFDVQEVFMKYGEYQNYIPINYTK